MLNENQLGFEYRDENKIIFFGKKKTTLENLKIEYPDLEFRQVKQTHSDICIESISQDLIEADAHFTHLKKVALLIKTADCLPVMIYSDRQKIIMAVHAGWRGVENKIVFKSIQKAKLDKKLEIFIGPHILKDFFEVDKPEKDLLIQAVMSEIENPIQDLKSGKFFVDLQSIVKSQIDFICPNSHFYYSVWNTLENEDFNSYRTDKTQARNLSFIALL